MDDIRTFLACLCKRIGNTSTDDSGAREFHPDESELFEKCLFHQVIPHVYLHREFLQRTFPNLSAAFFERIREYTIYNMTRIMLYESFLKDFLFLLDREQIDYRILKGIVLAYDLYDQPYLRTFGDIDLLVRQEDLLKVDAVLKNFEFHLADDLYSNFPDAVTQKFAFARHYIRSNPADLAVDVHLDISSKLHPFHFDRDDFWAHYKEVNIDGISCKTFSDEYAAIFLLYHAFKHYYFKIMWILDVFLLLRRPGFDWERYSRLVKEYRLGRLWSIFLRVSLDLFGTYPVDSHSSAELTVRPISKMIQIETILEGSLPYSPSINRLILPLFYMSSFQQKTRYLWMQLFPPLETIIDFHMENGMQPTLRNYLRLRGKAICELIAMAWKQIVRGKHEVL